MINEAYKAMLGGKSVIRELSEYATARGAEIGYENVFDYSLGNPSVPCPQDYTDAVIDMYKTAEPPTTSSRPRVRPAHWRMRCAW